MDKLNKKIKKVLMYIFTTIFSLQVVICNLFSAFREINFTARGAGLAGAFCALSDSADGVIYNPAGIGQVARYELNFSHTKLFTGLEGVNINLNYGGIVFPSSWFNSAFNYSELLEDNYKERVMILTFTKDITFLFNKIYNEEMKLFSGINLKYLQNQFVLDQRTINDPVFKKGNSKDNYTIDVGLLFVKDQISVGISGKNLTQPDTGLVSEEILPMELRFGLGYKFSSSMIMWDISYRAQQWGNVDDKINIHLGLESEIFRDVLSLVGGINMTEFSCGFLFKVPAKTKFESKINFSFSYPYYLMNTSGNYRFSFVIRI